MLISLYASGVVWSGQTFAEERDPSWQVSEEIVVVGDRGSGYGADQASVVRGDIDLFKWPQSIQVLNRTLIEEQNAQSLTDALANVSSVVASQDQEQVLVNPAVRGLESEVYLDGLIAYGDTAVIDPSSLAVVERIEVAKGATSVLFGGGVGAPTGGLINLVTKTPSPDERYEFVFRGGSHATKAIQADLNQPFNKGLAVRLAGEWFEADDTIDEVEIKRQTLNPSLSWQASDDTRVLIRGFYNQIEQLEYTGLPAEVATIPGVSPEQFTGAANAPLTDIENTAVHVTVDHAVNDDLALTMQARYFESSFDEYSSFPFLSFFPITDTSAPIIRGQLPVDTDEITVDVALKYNFEIDDIRHNVLFGVTWDETDYEAGSGFDFFPIGVLDYASGMNTLDFGPIPEINRVVENVYETTAAYLQNHIAIGEKLHVLLSGRYSRYSLDEIAGGTGADETYSEFDPRLGITYAINDSVSIFGGYATGSRIVPFFTGVNSRPPVPEESKSYELGLKFSAETLSGTLAVFKLERDRIPQTDLTDPFFGSVQNGKQASEGVELDLIWEPSSNLSVIANAAYVDARNETDIASFGTIFADGNALSRVPEKSARLAGRYRFTAGALSGLGLGLGATYADEAPLTDANQFESDAYTVFDFQADYQINRISLRLNVVNLTDKEYFKPWQYLLQEVVRQGQERSIYLSVGVEL